MTSQQEGGWGTPEGNGSSLDAFCGTPMEPELFLRLAIGITNALAVLHRQKIVHLRVNPRAILVNPETFAVLITGTPDQFPAITSAGVADEMFPYMSPEQTGRMNRTIDYRTDLYSLGATFYEMLTGTLPFLAGDIMEWVHDHIARAPLPPGEVVPEIPAILSDMVM
jgi:serine/threonine protein kinase